MLTDLAILRRTLPPVEVSCLDNGLTVCVARSSRAPVVATALVYRVGTRDELHGQGGTAHFLEHMMFKGSQRFGPGEIDRLTRALGGSNNAYTSHDVTLYYFTFASDRWRHALEIEVDRLAALTLESAEVESERQVILEEIAMYEGEPWSALEQDVLAAFYLRHAYGRPVLGSRRELATIDHAVLRAFHEQFYRPANAVLVVAGDVDEQVVEMVEDIFGGLEGVPAGRVTEPELESGPERLVRVQRRQGEVPRMLLALPAPAATHPDHPFLRLLTAVLASGRSSRLNRALVDRGQLCVWVAADVSETPDPGTVTIAAELVSGVEPARVEAELMRQLELLLGEAPPTAEELERAKRIVFADWIFAHEKIHQQAFLLGSALALFDAEHPWRYLECLLAARADDLPDVGRRYLVPQRSGVLGWSLPQA